MTLDRKRLRPTSAARQRPDPLGGIRGIRTEGHDADEVFTILRSAVLDHRLAPGTQLKEQALADALGCNRAVIRAAFGRLASARLVEHKPNRGVFVATPSRVEARDIFAARRVIEAAVVQALCACPQPAAVTAMRQLVAREQASYRAGSTREGLRLSVEFHRLLAKAAGNGVLCDFLEELLGRTPLVVLSFTTADAHNCALDEHSAIVDAIERGDAQGAIALMDAHIDHLERRANGEAAAGGHVTVADREGVAG